MSNGHSVKVLVQHAQIQNRAQLPPPTFYGDDEVQSVKPGRHLGRGIEGFARRVVTLAQGMGASSLKIEVNRMRQSLPTLCNGCIEKVNRATQGMHPPSHSLHSTRSVVVMQSSSISAGSSFPLSSCLSTLT